MVVSGDRKHTTTCFISSRQNGFALAIAEALNNSLSSPIISSCFKQMSSVFLRILITLWLCYGCLWQVCYKHLICTSIVFIQGQGHSYVTIPIVFPANQKQSFKQVRDRPLRSQSIIFIQQKQLIVNSYLICVEKCLTLSTA